MTKTLPCKVCGKPVTIPAKYARAKSTICPECSEVTRTSKPSTPRPKHRKLQHQPAYIAGQIFGLFICLGLPILLLAALSNPTIYGLYEAAFRGFTQGIEAGSECRDRDPLYGGC